MVGVSEQAGDFEHQCRQLPFETGEHAHRTATELLEDSVVHGDLIRRIAYHLL